MPGPQTSAMPVNAGAAPEPDDDQRGGPPDGDRDDPRMQQRGMGGYR
jgi:hypothetical protein